DHQAATALPGRDRHRRRRRRGKTGRLPGDAEVHLTGTEKSVTMAEILVLVDHVDGAVRKTTLELLTLARRAGEPAAVFFGTGYEQAAQTLGEYGAAKVYVADAPEFAEYVVAPKAEALAQIAESARPAAVLIPSSPDGTEIAA